MPQGYAMLSKYTPPAITAGFILYVFNHLTTLEENKESLGSNNILFLMLCTLMFGLSYRYYNNKLPRNLRNTQTFWHLLAVEEIPPLHLLILDKYAFDSRELAAYAAHYPHRLGRNPHTNILFSILAKNQLRAHPDTCNGMVAMEHQIDLENKLITDDIVDRVIELLTTIDNCLNPVMVEPEFESEEDEEAINAEENPDQEAEWENDSDESSDSDPMAEDEYMDTEANIFVPEACNEAVINFQIYYNQLKAAQRNTLRNYYIEMYSTRGAIQGLEFCAALSGGDNVKPCVKTLQIYLWQFVVDFKSDMMAEIPPAVNKAAAAAKLKIRDNYSVVTYQGQNNTHCCARLFKRLQGNNHLPELVQLASPRMGRF